MDIKKALITAAGKSQRTLPLQSLVDRDGTTKTALTIIIEEILRAGVDTIGVVISPGDQEAYRAAAGKHAARLTFVEQPEPLGYAHAIYCAADFCGGDPFLLLVGDHLYLSATEKGCAQQLVEIARTENCAVSAVQPTHESKLPYYGAVGGQLVNAGLRLYQVDTVLEKPTPTEAEQKIDVPGLRAGFYLGFFGMHVLTPAVQRILADLFSTRKARRTACTSAPRSGGWRRRSVTSRVSWRAALRLRSENTGCSPRSSRWRFPAPIATKCSAASSSCSRRKSANARHDFPPRCHHHRGGRRDAQSVARRNLPRRFLR
jgi:UTP--glucose-1-phosphate uridylyltransferase